VLAYRWGDVDLGFYRLLGNPSGTDLSGLLNRLLKHKFLSNFFLLKNGYMPFGRGPDIDYDPVCFNLKSREKTGEFAIVKLDHEEILCNGANKIGGSACPYI